MQRTGTVIAITLLLGMAAAAAAQTSDYQVVSSPFQEDFDYQIGTDLQPLVEIDSIRWTRLSIIPKGNNEIVADKDVAFSLELEFSNQGPESATVLVIVLFEDENGGPLDRVESKPFKIGGERLKESIQKFKLPGTVLLETRKVYLFCEINR